MKRANKTLKATFLLMLCACLCLMCRMLPAAANTGTEVDDEGGVWDYDNNTYTDPDGNVYPITPEGVQDENSDTTPTPAPGDDGGIEVGGDGEDPPIALTEDPTRAPIEGDDWKALLDRVAARNGRYTPTVYIDPVTGASTEVQVVYMGIGRSMVTFGGQQRLVNTVDLRWETNVPDDMVMAVIDAPKNGYAQMRAGMSKKSTLIKQCRTCSVVRVISSGKNWTLIDHEGTRGYVQTASLEFFCNDHTDFEAGWVSVKGRIKGNDSANIRSRDSKLRVLADYKLGTPLTVFDIIDDWAEVDVGGWHCYINKKYVTLEQEIASSE